METVRYPPWNPKEFFPRIPKFIRTSSFSDYIHSTLNIQTLAYISSTCPESVQLAVFKIKFSFLARQKFSCRFRLAGHLLKERASILLWIRAHISEQTKRILKNESFYYYCRFIYYYCSDIHSLHVYMVIHCYRWIINF